MSTRCPHTHAPAHIVTDTQMHVCTLTQHHEPTKVSTHMLTCTLIWPQANMHTCLHGHRHAHLCQHDALTCVYMGTCPHVVTDTCAYIYTHMITEICHKHTQGHVPTHTQSQAHGTNTTTHILTGTCPHSCTHGHTASRVHTHNHRCQKHSH